MVACPSCRSLSEIDAVLAPGAAAPLCDACRAASAAPPPPERRRSRPKVPIVDFGRLAPDEAAPHAGSVIEQEPLSLDDLEIASIPSSKLCGAPPRSGFIRSERPSAVSPPDPASRRALELASSDLAGDVEAVSLRDLDIVLGPASVPPAWEAAPAPGLSEVASNLKPRSSRTAAKPPPLPPPKAKPAAADKPTFFDVGAGEIPVETEETPSVPPSSDRVDLMSLVAPPSLRPARPAELFLLQGGLFADAVPPAQIDRPQPSSRRPLPPREEVVEVPVDVDMAAVAPRVPRSIIPEPLVSEHWPTSRRSGLLGWGAGAVAAAAVIALVAARLGGGEAPREALVVTAPAAPPSSVDEVRPAVEPAREPVATAEAPKPPEKQLAAPPSPARVADPPRPVAEVAPPKERPAVVAPRRAPPKEEPAPSGADFDRAAARAALAAAAAAASACKHPDDPSGGARVSVTFVPSGRVTSSRVVGSPFQGTQTGSCIARAFRGITVPAFAGEPVTVTKEISVR